MKKLKEIFQTFYNDDQLEHSASQYQITEKLVFLLYTFLAQLYFLLLAQIFVYSPIVNFKVESGFVDGHFKFCHSDITTDHEIVTTLLRTFSLDS